jgi:hypothetical protein
VNYVYGVVGHKVGTDFDWVGMLDLDSFAIDYLVVDFQTGLMEVFA